MYCIKTPPLNILLTHSYFLEEDPKERQIMKPYVPLGILYVSAFLEQHGFSNSVFDSTFSTFSAQQNYIRNTCPDVLAVYTNLMTRINVIKLIKWVKTEPSLAQTKIILGGPEVRHHARGFLETGADCVVVGEGEQTMLELVQHLNNGQALEHVNGVVFKTPQGEFVQTPERALIKDLSELPLPNRKKVDFEPYLKAWKTKHGFSMMSVNTMRGCPYTCKWCSRAVYGGTYRRRKPEQVADELLFLKQNYNPDMIWFVDDVFTIHHKWLKQFAEAVKAKEAVIPYEIISRADRLNEEVIQLLKESGCYRIWIGAESGSQRIIDAMDRRVDVMETRRMIQMARRYGIKAGTFIMLGYPGETRADIKETIEHLIEANPDDYTVTIAYPIKGTTLYNEVEADITTPWQFEYNTDRDLDFKRRHPRRYYEYGVKWVYTAVYRCTREKSKFKKLFLWCKEMYYQARMLASG